MFTHTFAFLISAFSFQQITMSIYFKLVLLCSILVFFTISTIFYFVNQEAQNTLKEQILSDLSKQAEHGMDNIERFIYQRVGDIKSIALHPVFKDKNATKEAINKVLIGFQNSNELYYSFSYFDMNRIRKADTKGLSIGEQHPLKIYWKKITEKTEVEVDVSMSVSVGSIVMHFAAVVRNDEGKAIGVIVSRVLIDRLYEVFQDISVDNDNKDNSLINIDLVDKEGTLLYSNYNQKKVLVEQYESFSDLQAIEDKEVLKIIESDKKIFFYIKEQGYLGYKGNQWILVMSVPLKIIQIPIQNIQNKLLILVAIILSVSIVISLLAAWRFVQPIYSLTNAAKEMEEGNLDVKVHVNTHDELRVLGKQLNAMAKNLKKKMEEQTLLNQDLEAKYVKINEQKEEIETQKNQIEEQKHQITASFDEIKSINKSMTESIYYAKRIQSSMLPEPELLQEAFSDSFIVYKPKDIVSGDFYWYEKINYQGKRYFVIAGADCTGHGVPGSIMAMLGSNLLTNIISYRRYLDSSEILLRLNKYIKEELNQEKNEQNSQDGMEIALCVIDLDTMQLQFSGGGRPLYIFRNDEFTEFKGDKITIGGVGYRSEKRKRRAPITIQKHCFDLQKGDVIYMFSDGYKDQFGGDQGRKLGTTKFQFLLKEVSGLDLQAQRNILESTFDKWRAGNEQVDDVLVMGLKV